MRQRDTTRNDNSRRAYGAFITPRIGCERECVYVCACVMCVHDVSVTSQLLLTSAAAVGGGDGSDGLGSTTTTTITTVGGGRGLVQRYTRRRGN